MHLYVLTVVIFGLCLSLELNEPVPIDDPQIDTSVITFGVDDGLLEQDSLAESNYNLRQNARKSTKDKERTGASTSKGSRSTKGAPGAPSSKGNRKTKGAQSGPASQGGHRTKGDKGQNPAAGPAVPSDKGSNPANAAGGGRKSSEPEGGPLGQPPLPDPRPPPTTRDESGLFTFHESPRQSSPLSALHCENYKLKDIREKLLLLRETYTQLQETLALSTHFEEGIAGKIYIRHGNMLYYHSTGAKVFSRRELCEKDFRIVEPGNNFHDVLNLINQAYPNDDPFTNADIWLDATWNDQLDRYRYGSGNLMPLFWGIATYENKVVEWRDSLTNETKYNPNLCVVLRTPSDLTVPDFTLKLVSCSTLEKDSKKQPINYPLTICERRLTPDYFKTKDSKETNRQDLAAIIDMYASTVFLSGGLDLTYSATCKPITSSSPFFDNLVEPAEHLLKLMEIEDNRQDNMGRIVALTPMFINDLRSLHRLIDKLFYVWNPTHSRDLSTLCSCMKQIDEASKVAREVKDKYNEFKKYVKNINDLRIKFSSLADEKEFLNKVQKFNEFNGNESELTEPVAQLVILIITAIGSLCGIVAFMLTLFTHYVPRWCGTLCPTWCDSKPMDDMDEPTLVSIETKPLKSNLKRSVSFSDGLQPPNYTPDEDSKSSAGKKKDYFVLEKKSKSKSKPSKPSKTPLRRSTRNKSPRIKKLEGIQVGPDQILQSLEYSESSSISDDDSEKSMALKSLRKIMSRR